VGEWLYVNMDQGPAPDTGSEITGPDSRQCMLTRKKGDPGRYTWNTSAKLRDEKSHRSLPGRQVNEPTEAGETAPRP